MRVSGFECERVIKYLTSQTLINLWGPTILNATHIQHSYNYKQPYSLHLSTTISIPNQCSGTNCEGPRFNYTNSLLIHFQGSCYHVIIICLKFWQHLPYNLSLVQIQHIKYNHSQQPSRLNSNPNIKYDNKNPRSWIYNFGVTSPYVERRTCIIPLALLNPTLTLNKVTCATA